MLKFNISPDWITKLTTMTNPINVYITHKKDVFATSIQAIDLNAGMQYIFNNNPVI